MSQEERGGPREEAAHAYRTYTQDSCRGQQGNPTLRRYWRQRWARRRVSAELDRLLAVPQPAVGEVVLVDFTESAMDWSAREAARAAA